MSVQALDAREGEIPDLRLRTAACAFAPITVRRGRVFSPAERPCPPTLRLGPANLFFIQAWFPSFCRRSVPLPPEKRDAAPWLRNHAVGGRLMSIPAAPSTAENGARGRPMLAPLFGAKIAAIFLVLTSCSKPPVGYEDDARSMASATASEQVIATRSLTCEDGSVMIIQFLRNGELRLHRPPYSNPLYLRAPAQGAAFEGNGIRLTLHGMSAIVRDAISTQRCRRE